MMMIPKGARWVCKNGHVIATFNRDISGGITHPDHLDWIGDKPALGSRVGDYKCPTCGAPPAFDSGIGSVGPHILPPEA